MSEQSTPASAGDDPPADAEAVDVVEVVEVDVIDVVEVVDVEVWDTDDPEDDWDDEDGMGDDAVGGFDMGSLLDQALQMQQQLMSAQQQAAATEVEGQAGGGMVRVRVTGGMQFLGVTIAPEVVDPDDVEMLQDLVLAALHDAVTRVGELSQQAMGGLDLGGLGGLLGGGQ